MVTQILTRGLIALTLLLGVFTTGMTHAADLVASVDRTQIGEHDTLILTVKYGEQLLTDGPDFSPLQQQFQVGATSRKNSFQMINGQTSSWTIWTIGLTPKRKGNLVVPSLTFRGAKSDPIQIRVVKASDALKDQDKDVFFVTQTDNKQSYIQGQVVYTEKLFFAVALDNSDISEVAVADAIVQPLGDTKQYRTQLNGRSYNVYERRFAIFPQASGEMIIPGPRYSGEISNGPWRPGRPIRISHPPIKVSVLPQPANSQGNAWLPSERVEIQHTWSTAPDQLTAGEPTTLTININALGLSGSQLPDINLSEIPQLKYYPDQASSSDSATEQGILGTRSQKIAIVANKAGEFLLPEIRIAWWNTKTQQQDYAVIPAQALKVKANAQSLTSAPLNAATALAPSQHFEEGAEPLADNQASSSVWPWLTLLTTLLWIATAGLWWWSAQRQSHITADTGLPRLSEIEPAKPKAIKQACRDNNPTAARAAILSWANAQLADMQSKPFTKLGDLIHYTDDAHLHQALLELDHTLYSALGNSAWQGEHLWQLIKQWQPKAKTTTSTVLKALYPSDAKAVAGSVTKSEAAL